MRESHRRADGEVRRVGTLFSTRCRYPRDPLGPIEEIAGCRCHTRPTLSPKGATAASAGGRGVEPQASAGGPGPGGGGGPPGSGSSSGGGGRRPPGGGGGVRAPARGGGDGEGRRARRMAQLRAMPQEELDTLVEHIRRSRKLPRLRYHLYRHGPELGVRTTEELDRLFEEHLQRDDLRYFTFLRRNGEKMWYLLSEGTGRVAQYNESRQRPWTFFAPDNLNRFLEEGLVRWVEVRRTEAGWQPTDEPIGR